MMAVRAPDCSLEMARVLAQNPALPEKIELVFFDGEEAFENFRETDGLYGSRLFCRGIAQARAE